MESLTGYDVDLLEQMLNWAIAEAKYQDFTDAEIADREAVKRKVLDLLQRQLGEAS